MHEIGVDESVSEKGPQIGGETAGKCAADAGIGAVARRDEGEGQKKLDVLLVRQHQHAEDMHEHEHATVAMTTSGTLKMGSRIGVRIRIAASPVTPCVKPK